MYKSPRRSLLFVPGSSIKMINKSLESEADSIILDLEDAVSLQEKESARNNVKKYISKFKEKNIEVIVRINELKTRLGMVDMEEIAQEEPDALLIPKADESVIAAADILMDSIELRYEIEKNSLKIIPLVETTECVNNISAVINNSPRITGVLFGAEDLTSEMGIPRQLNSAVINNARCLISLAAHQYEIDAIDTPLTNFTNNEELRQDSLAAKEIGFTGKACIHPRQLEIVNELFSPAKEDIRKAEELIKAFNISTSEGKGAFSFEGKMVDLPIVDKAKKLIKQAESIKEL